MNKTSTTKQTHNHNRNPVNQSKLSSFCFFNCIYLTINSNYLNLEGGRGAWYNSKISARKIIAQLNKYTERCLYYLGRGGAAAGVPSTQRRYKNGLCVLCKHEHTQKVWNVPTATGKHARQSSRKFVRVCVFVKRKVNKRNKIYKPFFFLFVQHASAHPHTHATHFYGYFLP